MPQDKDLEQLTEALSEAWQNQVQKLMSDPFVQQASQNYMDFVNTLTSSEGASDDNTSPFSPKQSPTSSSAADDGSGSANLLATRLEECERRISLLEAVVHGLLKKDQKSA